MIKVESALASILKNTETLSTDLKSCKTKLSSLKSEADKQKRHGTCSENDSFRKTASGPILFLKDNQSKLTSLLQGDRDICPSDLGLQTFYQFVTSNRGAQLVEILSLEGQPTPQKWEHYDNWWLQSSHKFLDTEKLPPNSPDWAIKVMWRSKSFMAEYWNLSNKLVTNPFTLSVEEIMWSLHHLTQVFRVKINNNLSFPI